MNASKYQSVVQVSFPAYQAAPVSDKIRDSYAARNEVVSIPAFAKLPCTLGEIHNDTTTPLEIDYIDLGVVVNGIYFEDFLALNKVKEMCKEEGFDTTTYHTRFDEANITFYI